MKLTRSQIKKQEVIGKLRGRDVLGIETHGGLFLVAAHRNGQLVTVGAGPHRAVAKYIAEHKEPDIRWSECLIKSDADQDMVCPTCRQLDRPDECLCVYRWENAGKDA